MATSVLHAATLSQPGIRLAALPPLSLYIHIPWCVRKCPYCDFNSHEKRGELPEREYVDALIADLEFSLPSIWGRRVKTIFFGGGTPSLLSARALDDILSAVRARVPLEPDAEITLEANPGTFEAQKFREFRALGINRLSIGIQSFNAQHLKALGRIHDDAEARRAIEIAQANFDNFNLDLMYALPQQTLAEALQDIETALAFEPPHLSAYHLTLEPNTLFYKQPPLLPDDDTAADMQQRIEERLAAAGYENYETSAFAHGVENAGRRCKHNLNYWQFGDYLGIGAGAHGKISFPDRIERTMRYKQPAAYLKHALASVADAVAALTLPTVQETHEVQAGDLPFEFMMNALRLCDGFPVALFQERTGLPIHVIQDELAQAEARGLIERDHLAIKPTARGRRFLNDLLQIFLHEDKS
jgi:putative oxygen-independent coproporphyrinogen III oxidase